MKSTMGHAIGSVQRKMIGRSQAEKDAITDAGFTGEKQFDLVYEAVDKAYKAAIDAFIEKIPEATDEEKRIFRSRTKPLFDIYTYKKGVREAIKAGKKIAKKKCGIGDKTLDAMKLKIHITALMNKLMGEAERINKIMREAERINKLMREDPSKLSVQDLVEKGGLGCLTKLLILDPNGTTRNTKAPVQIITSLFSETIIKRWQSHDEVKERMMPIQLQTQTPEDRQATHMSQNSGGGPPISPPPPQANEDTWEGVADQTVDEWKVTPKVVGVDKQSLEQLVATAPQGKAFPLEDKKRIASRKLMKPPRPPGAHAAAPEDNSSTSFLALKSNSNL
jgi:hypothetical protein